MVVRRLPIAGISEEAVLTDENLPKLATSKFTIEYVVPGMLEERSIIPEGYTECKVMGTKLLTGPNALKPVYSFTLEMPGHGYLPGDSFDVMCENSDERTDDLLQRLSINPNATIVIREEHFLSDKMMSVRSLFKKHLDVNQFPKKAFLRHLAEFTGDALEKQTLYYLSSRLGSASYLALAREYSNLADFLCTFPSCKPPLECVILHSSPLAPRAYSVCSFEPDSVEFICTIDAYTTPEPDAQKRLGICSEYLYKHIEDIRSLWIRPRPVTSMRFPQEKLPVIMICAGAGLSPFLGFLRYAAALKMRMEGSLLFYGFRSVEDDFLCREEFEEYVKSGVLGTLRVAVSRDPVKPQYVQDVMGEHDDEIFTLMQEKQARIYLCGDEMTMIRGVNERLERICVEKGGNKALLLEWNKEKRIIRDIWV